MIRNKLVGKLKAERLESLERFDKENPASKHIPIRYFITPEIFSTQKNELGAVIRIEGTPFEVQDKEEILAKQSALGFLIQSLGDEFAVYLTTHRRQQTCQLPGNYPEGFAKSFAKAYQKQFESSELFVNGIYLTLLLKAGSKKTQKSVAWLERFHIKNNDVQRNEWHDARLRQFKTALTNLMRSLASYGPHILGEKVGEQGLPEAEVLGFLSVLINGEQGHYTYPYQDIASFIPKKRLFFGNNTIHFQGLTQGDDLYGAVMSIKDYCPRTAPGLLDGLLTLPFEYVSTHSFLSIEKNHALELIEKQTRRLKSTDDAAISQIEQLSQAKDDLASGRINYGFHHNTLLVLSRTLSELDDNVAKVIKHYQDQYLVVVRETLNVESAFWAQIPGNANYIRRQSLISSINFSCFCSLHNYYAGYTDANHLGSALMLVETASKTPLYFNLHEKASGRIDDLPKGHTTVIGPSNAGKTVIMTTIDSMLKKYGIRSFFFDRNYGMEIYVRAMGGVYNRLMPGIATGWNPCQLEDTPKNRQFLRELIEVLASSATQELTARDINQIADVVDRNYSLPLEKRTLSNIASFFSLDFSGNEALSRYLRLKDKTGRAGERAYLFDNDSDNLNLNVSTMGFDMTHWLSDAGQPSDALLPISMYLFHRIENVLDGKLTGLYLSEGWQFLNQAYWSSKIDEFLVTWRKRNAFIFFDTQLPEKLAASSLAGALIEGSATNIFLANPKAKEADYMGAFHLSRREYEIIKTTNAQSRYFLIKQGLEAAIARINLSGLENYMAVLSGNDNSVALSRTICEEVGDNPEKWLPLFYERKNR